MQCIVPLATMYYLHLQICVCVCTVGIKFQQFQRIVSLNAIHRKTAHEKELKGSLKGFQWLRLVQRKCLHQRITMDYLPSLCVCTYGCVQVLVVVARFSAALLIICVCVYLFTSVILILGNELYSQRQGRQNSQHSAKLTKVPVLSGGIMPMGC